MNFLEILVPRRLFKIAARGGGLYGSGTLHWKGCASQVSTAIGQKFKIERTDNAHKKFC